MMERKKSQEDFLSDPSNTFEEPDPAQPTTVNAITTMDPQRSIKDPITSNEEIEKTN